MSQMTHECFADEIAIDFPSVGHVVDRMRDAFLGEHADADVLRAEVSLSQREAFAGLVVLAERPGPRSPVRTAAAAAKRGPSRARSAAAPGESLFQQARARLGAAAASPTARAFRFRLKSPDASSVRVELRVAIRSSAA